jgi:hypothetical protein
MQKAADYFNVDYRSILNHLDTELATIKGGKLVLLFSHELTKRFATEKESLPLRGIQKAVNVTVSVWVYKKVNDKLILLNDNKPTYSSRLEASKELKMSFVCEPRQRFTYETWWRSLLVLKQLENI